MSFLVPHCLAQRRDALVVGVVVLDGCWEAYTSWLASKHHGTMFERLRRYSSTHNHIFIPNHSISRCQAWRMMFSSNATRTSCVDVGSRAECCATLADFRRDLLELWNFHRRPTPIAVEIIHLNHLKVILVIMIIMQNLLTLLFLQLRPRRNPGMCLCP